MLIETSLCHLAKHARSLLDCGGASLFLGCSEPALRHPLLSMLSPDHTRTPFCDGIQADAIPLDDERLNALYDMAWQTGLMWCIDHIALPGMEHIGSIAAVSLERPGGILGLLLLIDPAPEAFQQGECRLVEQHLPAMARQVEEILSDVGLASPADLLNGDIVTNVQEQSEFLSLVSHELRVPLTAIKGYAGLLQAYGIFDSQDDEHLTMQMTAERQQEYLDVIMEQANHLEVLVGDLHDMSRIQSGRLALRCTWVDIAQLCHRAAQLIQYRVDQQQRGVYCIRCILAPDLPLVWADPDRVQQVLTNLIENAVKYSPNGGMIDVMAYTRRTLYPVTLCPLPEEEDETVQERRGKTFSSRGSFMTYVTIRDRGVGIPRLQQSHLFKPFTRLEHPATTNVTGAGLGLYLSRKLVEAMNGTMALKSNEGRGTSVTFTLPSEHSGEPDASCLASQKAVSQRY